MKQSHVIGNPINLTFIQLKIYELSLIEDYNIFNMNDWRENIQKIWDEISNNKSKCLIKSIRKRLHK